MSLVRTLLAAVTVSASAALAQGATCPEGYAPGQKGTPGFSHCVENGTHTCPKPYLPWAFADKTWGCARAEAKKPCDASKNEVAAEGGNGAKHTATCELTNYATCAGGFHMMNIHGQLQCVSNQPMPRSASRK